MTAGLPWFHPRGYESLADMLHAGPAVMALITLTSYSINLTHNHTYGACFWLGS